MPQQKVNFVEFQGRHSNSVCEDAAELATKIGKERLIDISHSNDHAGAYTVVVWYWDESYVEE
jgi:hypothetical protein